jgi:VanZ family protein
LGFLAFLLSEPGVSEQSWRNPRPAPALAELRARTPAPRSYVFLRAWWPALLWAGVIFCMSTDAFSSEHTGAILRSILHWLYSAITDTQFAFIHHLIRKSVHFTEYFIFCLFLYRGVRGDGTGWRWSWAFTSLFIAAAYAALDEVHQAFVASRTASPYDSLLDSIGAFFALVFLFLWLRVLRSKSPTAEVESV